MELEKQILNGVNDAIKISIVDSLSGYNSPLRKLSDKVVQENEEKIHLIMNKAFKFVISTDSFKKTILEEFQHKVAKMLVSNLSGQVEKSVNIIKQDPTLKAKMILAIENIIEENA